MRFLMVLLMSWLAVGVQAASLSEIDLLTRQEIVNFFSAEGVLVDFSQDIEVHGFVTPHDEVLCDLEVSTTVHYTKGEKAVSEACFVCFAREAGVAGRALIEPVQAYCVE